MREIRTPGSAGGRGERSPRSTYRPKPALGFQPSAFAHAYGLFWPKASPSASAHGVGLGASRFRRSRPPVFRLSKTNPKKKCPYSAFATSDRVLTQPGRSQRASLFLTSPLRWPLWRGIARVTIKAAAGPPGELAVSQTGDASRHLGGSDVSVDLSRRQTPMT